MDKYNQRKFHAKKLAKERYSSLFFFFVAVWENRLQDDPHFPMSPYRYAILHCVVSLFYAVSVA